MQTYEHYCKKTGSEICHMTRGWVAELGWWVFRQPTEVISGANVVLEQLSGHMSLFLATKGDPEIQSFRLKESGLAGYFRKVYIVPDKTHKEYTAIAAESGLNPAHSWVIGNSMKGDINPGLKSGFNCIHVYHHATWDFEEEAPQGDFFEVKSIREVPGIILNY